MSRFNYISTWKNILKSNGPLWNLSCWTISFLLDVEPIDKFNIIVIGFAESYILFIFSFLVITVVTFFFFDASAQVLLFWFNWRRVDIWLDSLCKPDILLLDASSLALDLRCSSEMGPEDAGGVNLQNRQHWEHECLFLPDITSHLVEAVLVALVVGNSPACVVWASEYYFKLEVLAIVSDNWLFTWVTDYVRKSNAAKDGAEEAVGNEEL